MKTVNRLINSVSRKYLAGLLLALAVTLALLSFSSTPVAAAIAPGFASNQVDQEKAGAILFRDKGCAYCHGASGEGTSKGPSLAKLRKNWTAAAITQQIVNGGQKMPAFEDSLSKDEVAQLVTWLRAKHRIAPPSPAKLSTPAQ